MSFEWNESVTFRDKSGQWLDPVQLSPETILRASAAPDVIEGVIALLERLQPDDFITYTCQYYREGLRRFGEAWGYTDILTVLYTAARYLKPKSYLEIGVFRGRSMAMVAGVAPNCNLVGFDLWIDNYAGMTNPGPAFVKDQIKRVGHRGEITLVAGDSRETVPAFLQNHPDLYFDLVTVDGAHSAEGARIDLENVIPRIKVGGVLVFDDIRHPKHPWLERVWDVVVGTNPNFLTAKYTALGYGVAVAVRHADEHRHDEIVGDELHRLRTLSFTVDVLRVELDAIRAERDQLMSRCTVLSGERDRLTEYIKTIEIRQRQLMEQQAAWQRERDRLQEQLTSIMTEHRNLRQQLVTERQTYQQLKHAYLRLCRGINSLATTARALRDSNVYRLMRRLKRWSWVEIFLAQLEALARTSTPVPDPEDRGAADETE